VVSGTRIRVKQSPGAAHPESTATIGTAASGFRLLRETYLPASLLFSRRTLFRLTSYGFWAVLDQALFALSSLLINVLLARWLPPAEYGAFVTAFTVLLLIGVGYQALLTEPMLIYGGDRYRASFSEYLRLLCRYHWRLMLVVCVPLGLVGVYLSATTSPLLGRALCGLAVTAPLILLSWLARRACYAVSTPWVAATGGAINLGLTMIGAAILSWAGLFTVFSAQVLVGVAALVATGWMMLPLNRLTAAPLEAGPRDAVWSLHWRYGRWIAAMGACTWFQLSVFYFVLPIWGGLAAAGALKALLNLIMPILQSDGALMTLLVPVFVRSRRDMGRFARLVTGAAAVFAAEAVVYWIFLVIFGPRVLEFVYAGAYRYSVSALVLLGMLPLLGGLGNIIGNGLRALEEPNSALWGTVAGVIVAGTLGIAAAYFRGLEGAILGLVCSAGAQVGIMLWLFTKRVRTT
jgi:O-antigen/teichoic acid export membrane protein